MSRLRFSTVPSEGRMTQPYMSEEYKAERGDWPNDKIPRCTREHFASFLGRHRAPCSALPDEDGAAHVVELLFGGRAAFRPEPSAPGAFRVDTLE